MDSGRARDGREERVLPRPPYARDRPQGFRRDSPPFSLPSRSAFATGYPAIPLRPAGPQRNYDPASASSVNGGTPYWRADGGTTSAQLPPRPVQRYRSPPPALPTLSNPPPRQVWERESRRERGPVAVQPERERGPADRGWGTRDDFRSAESREVRNGAPGSWGRDSERAERERGSRPFMVDARRPGGGGFEVPYRNRVASRKRTRESSDEDDRDDDRGHGSRPSRSRPGSPERRRGDLYDRERGSRPRLIDGGKRSIASSQRYNDLDLREDYRARRPPSPSGSDTSYGAPSSSRLGRPSNRSPPRRARNRSYSPGEISDGPPRSLDSRSRSPSRSRSRSRSRSPPRDEQRDRRSWDGREEKEREREGRYTGRPTLIRPKMGDFPARPGGYSSSKLGRPSLPPSLPLLPKRPGHTTSVNSIPLRSASSTLTRPPGPHDLPRHRPPHFLDRPDPNSKTLLARPPPPTPPTPPPPSARPSVSSDGKASFAPRADYTQASTLPPPWPARRASDANVAQQTKRDTADAPALRVELDLSKSVVVIHLPDEAPRHSSPEPGLVDESTITSRALSPPPPAPLCAGESTVTISSAPPAQANLASSQQPLSAASVFSATVSPRISPVQTSAPFVSPLISKIGDELVELEEGEEEGELVPVASKPKQESTESPVQQTASIKAVLEPSPHVSDLAIDPSLEVAASETTTARVPTSDMDVDQAPPLPPPAAPVDEERPVGTMTPLVEEPMAMAVVEKGEEVRLVPIEEDMKDATSDEQDQRSQGFGDHDSLQQLSSPPTQTSSSPPQSPPRDFASILGHVIAANEEDQGDVNALMEVNRARTAKERLYAQQLRDNTNKEMFSMSLESHERLRPFLLESFADRDQRRGEKMVELRGQYKSLDEDWKAHCRRLDRIKDRIHRRTQPDTVPVTPSIDGVGLPFYPEPTTPGPAPIVTGRTNRRNNANNAIGYGDAVRSEAEFLEILASLESADMRDPNVRASRTAAIVPDMVVHDSERRDYSALDDDRRLVEDPEEFYGVQQPLDLWTEDEVQVFCKRFSQHPKQFGKISAELPDKSTAQCVLFYYRMKTTIDFRSLSDRRGRDRGRRTKTRRRADDAKGKKGASSLLANLKRARPDDRDDDDESPPPPSPQSSRRALESPSVFQMPGSTSRPGPPPATPLDNVLEEQDGGFPFSRPTSTAITPSGKTAKGPRTPKLSHLLPSDGMLEAAEALGALAGFGEGDEALQLDEKGIKRKDTEPGKSSSRRKNASSSYWSVAERNEFMRLLGQHGKDWARLAAGLENKTAVQCRNWFQNNAKKLNLSEIADNALDRFDEEADEETGGSALGTPGAEYTAPLGVPLSESLVPGGVALPRAGFFLPEKASMDDKVAKAGMQIRNLLNDDTPDEEVHTPARDDWFGAGTGDTGSVTTEDESDAPIGRPSSHSHPHHHSSFPQQEAQRKQDASFAAFQEGRRYSDGVHDSPAQASQYQHPPIPSNYTSVSPYPRDAPRGGRTPAERGPAPEQGRPIPLAQSWAPQHSTSFPPPYAPATTTNTPTVHFRFRAGSVGQDRPFLQSQPPPPAPQAQPNGATHPRFPPYASESRTW